MNVIEDMPARQLKIGKEYRKLILEGKINRLSPNLVARVVGPKSNLLRVFYEQAPLYRAAEMVSQQFDPKDMVHSDFHIMAFLSDHYYRFNPNTVLPRVLMNIGNAVAQMEQSEENLLYSKDKTGRMRSVTGDFPIYPIQKGKELSHRDILDQEGNFNISLLRYANYFSEIESIVLKSWSRDEKVNTVEINLKHDIPSDVKEKWYSDIADSASPDVIGLYLRFPKDNPKRRHTDPVPTIEEEIMNVGHDFFGNQTYGKERISAMRLEKRSIKIGFVATEVKDESGMQYYPAPLTLMNIGKIYHNTRTAYKG